MSVLAARMPAGIWSYRGLFWSLMVRNLRIKYQRSVLGFVWTVLNPLLMVGILASVFMHVVRIDVPHYPMFLLSSYFAWNFMMQTLGGGTYMLAEHAQLSRSVAFPKEIPVLASVASRLVEFAIEMLLILTMVGFLHHHGVPASWVSLPALIVLQAVLAAGLAFPISVGAVFYRDLQHLVPILLTSLFYISPVFYPASKVPEAARPYYMLNPLAHVLNGYQAVVYEGRFLTGMEWLQLSAIVAVFFGAGYAFFTRYKNDIAEVV